MHELVIIYKNVVNACRRCDDKTTKNSFKLYFIGFEWNVVCADMSFSDIEAMFSNNIGKAGPGKCSCKCMRKLRER